VLSRIASIDQIEMDKAFARANEGDIALVGLCSHDYRDLDPEVDFVRGLIAKSQEKYPDVKFKYCDGVTAFRLALGLDAENGEPLELSLTLNRNPANDVPNLEITTIKGKVFGPQPFLAIETCSRKFIHDNLDFSSEGNRWHYAFHADTLPLADVRRIGVGACDKYGNTNVTVVEV
jgi:hypothetical protein|tara:strand:+ start:96 stop:623 length:528 start_codon:yes stop_codon:yes gene_type:complete